MKTIVALLTIASLFAPSSLISEEAESQASHPSEIASGPLPAEEGKTIIRSDRLNVIHTGDGNQFIFFGSVIIRGEGFTAECDRMEIRTDSKGSDDFGAIALIEASGNVVITQGERKATAGRALIYPQEDKVVLEENPMVQDGRGNVSGYRMILQGESRKITVERGPEGQQPRVELPSLQSIRSDSEND